MTREGVKILRGGGGGGIKKFNAARGGALKFVRGSGFTNYFNYLFPVNM